MNKICLILLGVLAISALSSAWWGRSKEESLSEDLVYSRLARSPEAYGRKRKAGKKSSRRRGKSKGRKSKRGRKTKRKGGNRRKEMKTSARMEDSDTCFEKSITIMRMWKDIISNFEKQSKRMEKQNGTGVSKAGKAGIFAPIALSLIETGGGDKSNLSCAGSIDNAGAKQLKNLTNVLTGCEADIKKMCASFSKPNMTKLAECKVLAEKFKTGAQKCLDISIGADSESKDSACQCWTNATLDKTVQDAKMCKFPNEAKTIAEELKNCTKTFGKCRKYEDAVVTAISACSTNSGALTQKVSYF